MTDPRTSTTHELIDALAGGRVSSRELTESMLQRIDEVNPRLNAVVALDGDRALEAARRADDDLAAGRSHGALHGLPMTIKDVWETEGLVTACGAPELARHVPASDAVAVARLKAAGAVVVGKTNVPLYAGDLQTFNDVYGTTSNPWDLGRTPGGSSGGAAAAIAAGITSLELGSDIGGSIRVPSHFCGVFGLKPTWGVVPSRGHIPGPPGSLVEVDVNCGGPMGRSVADLSLALDVLAGPVDEEAVAWSLHLPPPSERSGRIEDLRLGVVFDDRDYPVAAEVVAVLRTAVDRLADAGAVVEEIQPPVGIDEGFRSWQALVLPVVGAHLPAAAFGEFAALAPHLGDSDDLGARSVRGLVASAREVMVADEHRRAQQRAWQPVFERFDAVLMPVLQTAALPHDPRSIGERTNEVDGRTISSLELSAWVGAVGAMRFPVVTPPVGFTGEGLPVGVQVVGPLYGDRRVLAAAAAMEAVLGGFVPAPC